MTLGTTILGMDGVILGTTIGMTLGIDTITIVTDGMIHGTDITIMAGVVHGMDIITATHIIVASIMVSIMAITIITTITQVGITQDQQKLSMEEIDTMDLVTLL